MNFSLKNGSIVEIKENVKEISIKPLQKHTLSEMHGMINVNNIHKDIN